MLRNMKATEVSAVARMVLMTRLAVVTTIITCFSTIILRGDSETGVIGVTGTTVSGEKSTTRSGVKSTTRSSFGSTTKLTPISPRQVSKSKMTPNSDNFRGPPASPLAVIPPASPLAVIPPGPSSGSENHFVNAEKDDCSQSNSGITFSDAHTVHVTNESGHVTIEPEHVQDGPHHSSNYKSSTSLVHRNHTGPLNANHAGPPVNANHTGPPVNTHSPTKPDRPQISPTRPDRPQISPTRPDRPQIDKLGLRSQMDRLGATVKEIHNDLTDLEVFLKDINPNARNNTVTRKRSSSQSKKTKESEKATQQSATQSTQSLTHSTQWKSPWQQREESKKSVSEGAKEEKKSTAQNRKKDKPESNKPENKPDRAAVDDMSMETVDKMLKEYKKEYPAMKPVWRMRSSLPQLAGSSNPHWESGSANPYLDYRLKLAAAAGKTDSVSVYDPLGGHRNPILRDPLGGHRNPILCRNGNPITTRAMIEEAQKGSFPVRKNPRPLLPTMCTEASITTTECPSITSPGSVASPGCLAGNTVAVTPRLNTVAVTPRLKPKQNILSPPVPAASPSNSEFPWCGVSTTPKLTTPRLPSSPRLPTVTTPRLPSSPRLPMPSLPMPSLTTPREILTPLTPREHTPLTPWQVLTPVQSRLRLPAVNDKFIANSHNLSPSATDAILTRTQGSAQRVQYIKPSCLERATYLQDLL